MKSFLQSKIIGILLTALIGIWAGYCSGEMTLKAAIGATLVDVVLVIVRYFWTDTALTTPKRMKALKRCSPFFVLPLFLLIPFAMGCNSYSLQQEVQTPSITVTVNVPDEALAEALNTAATSGLPFWWFDFYVSICDSAGEQGAQADSKLEAAVSATGQGAAESSFEATSEETAEETAVDQVPDGD